MLCMVGLFRFLLLCCATAFMAMFAEPFFSQALLLAGIDTSKWAGPVMMWLSDFTSQEWVRLLGSGVIGATVGTWLHWTLIKLEMSRSDAPSQLTTEILVRDIKVLHAILAQLNVSIQTLEDMPPYPKIEYISQMTQALELSLQKRKFQIPNLDFETDPIGFLERYEAYFQRIWPLLATGHIKEARAAAKTYVDTLHPDFMRPNRLKARQEKRRAKLASA